MSVTTINLIQTVNRSVSGIRFSPEFAKYPLAADSVRLPMVLTWPAAAQWDREHFGSKKRTDTTYQILVFVEALGQNTIGGRSTLAVALLDAFRDTWFALDTRGYPTALADPVNAGDHQVTVEWGGGFPNDTGITAELAMGATIYSGFTINLRVRELF